MKNRRGILAARLLFAISILGVAANFIIWLVQVTEAPSLFEWVEVLGWGVVIPLTFSSVGALIIARQPGNRLGWLMMVVALAVGNPISTISEYHLEPSAVMTPGLILWFWFDNWSWIPVIFPILLIPLHFPTGRPPSPRWGWVNKLAVGMWLFFILLTPFMEEVGPVNADWTVPNPIGFISNNIFDGPVGIAWGVGLAVMAVASVASLYVRFRGAETIERQQIKWLLYAAALLAVYYAVTVNVLPGRFDYLANLLFVTAITFIPIAIAIAILRYRLFDIDLIIRRTLQYSLLTALLALVYFGGVTVLQAFFTGVSGQQSPAAVVISTLIIAALFGRLRLRLQDFIDRRFYRQKYDAEKALAEFTAAARSETDLERLSSQMIQVARESLQPTYIGLWLRPEPGLVQRKITTSKERNL